MILKQSLRVWLLAAMVLGLWLLWQVGPTTLQAWHWSREWPACRSALQSQTDLSDQATAAMAKCARRLQLVTKSINKSWVLQPLLVRYLSHSLAMPVSETEELITTIADHFDVVQRELLTGTKKYIVLLQNSDELRATGGFPGTLAELQLQHGHVSALKMYDIFAPAGQFTGYKEAPKGVKTYLSGGESWKLPDANWSPDLPTSAQTVLAFLAESGWQTVDGVVVVNIQLIEQLLHVVGPVWLPDYQQEVTADNLAVLARADRDTFFPGSYQKPQFIQSLSTQLRLKLSQLSPHQYQELLKILLAARYTKDWQLYSRSPELESVWEQLSVANHWQPPADALPIGWIESNVGINKANQGIDRFIHLKLANQILTLSATYTNHNEPTAATITTDPVASAAAHSRTGHYVNYQRVWLPSTATVQSLSLGGVPQTDWDEEIIDLTPGQTVKEIGWLVTVAEQTQQTTEITVILPTTDTASHPLWLWKQPGLQTTWDLELPTSRQKLDLTRTMLIEW